MMTTDGDDEMVTKNPVSTPWEMNEAGTITGEAQVDGMKTVAGDHVPTGWMNSVCGGNNGSALQWKAEAGKTTYDDGMVTYVGMKVGRVYKAGTIMVYWVVTIEPAEIT